MGMDCLPVLALVLSAAAIGGAALHERSVHLVHEIAYQCRLQIVVAAHLARADFHCHPSVCWHSQSLVDTHQSLRTYLLGHVNLRLGMNRHCAQHCHCHYQHFLFHILIFNKFCCKNTEDSRNRHYHDYGFLYIKYGISRYSKKKRSLFLLFIFRRVI